MHSLWVRFSQKGPYIIVDKLRIKYKGKSFLTAGLLNTIRNQSFLWSEIKSVTLTYPYFKLGFIKFPINTGSKHGEALRLNLRNGQEKWIFIHTLPKYERQLLLRAIQKYKEVQTDKHCSSVKFE